MSAGQDSRDVAPASALPSSSEGATRGLDLSGLLCALVLAPGMYSRNRFFRMFEEPGARRVRRRANHVRSVLRSLRERGNAGEVLPDTRTHGEGGTTLSEDVEISFHVPSLGLLRRTRLAPLELSLVRYALKVGSDGVRAHDKAVVEGSLARLAPALGSSNA